jgi:hypothetical protein
MFVLALFISGCEALRMSPDAWLHPPRWQETEAANTQDATIKTADSQQSQTQF